MSKPVCVLGAGAFGTALAILLAKNAQCVRLWGNEPDQIYSLVKTRINESYLPGILLPENIEPRVKLTKALADVKDVFIAVPSHAFPNVIDQLPSGLRIAWGTKGLAPSGQWLHEVVQEKFGDIPMAAIGGPSFAMEIANDLPTAVTLGCNQHDYCRELSVRLHSRHFRVYHSYDILGVEIGGAVKNILAVATGMAAGLQMGDNAQAALITRGLAEIMRFGRTIGADTETLMSLAGVGDLVLTCTSDQSRNRRFGYLLAEGYSVDEAQAQINGVVEARHNLCAIVQLAKKHHVDMPITNQVYAVLFKNLPINTALANLLNREQP